MANISENASNRRTGNSLTSPQRATPRILGGSNSAVVFIFTKKTTWPGSFAYPRSPQSPYIKWWGWRGMFGYVWRVRNFIGLKKTFFFLYQTAQQKSQEALWWVNFQSCVTAPSCNPLWIRQAWLPLGQFEKPIRKGGAGGERSTSYEARFWRYEKLIVFS